MVCFEYTNQQMDWLRSRWTGDLINRIVIALNEGNDIAPIVNDVPRDEKIPTQKHRLDLRGIDFSHQNLRGPWERRAEERFRVGIRLPGADLTGAIMNWIILPRADLRGAILKNADLRSAELIYTDFSEADLTGAALDGAWLLDTKFFDAKITEEQLHRRRNLGQLDFDYHAYEI